MSRLLVAAVAGAVGVRGEVKLKSFTAEPGACCAYGPLSDESGRSYQPKLVRVNEKGLVVARLSGVGDRNAAETLRGLKLYAPRDALPDAEEDEFYHADLIGLRAELADGTAFGDVRALHDFGAGELIEIGGVAKDKGGPVVILPFTKVACPVVDLAGGRVVVDPPSGLAEPAEKTG